LNTVLGAASGIKAAPFRYGQDARESQKHLQEGRLELQEAQFLAEA